MDKKKWDSKQKIAYVLKLQEQGMNRKEIAINMEYTRLDTLDRLMKKHGYDKVGGIYKAIEDNCPINDLTTSNANENKEEDKWDIDIPKFKEDSCSISVVQNKEVQEKLLNMVKKYDSFIKIVDWFDNGGHVEDNSTIIEVNTGLQLDFKKSEVIKTTIRTDKDIWEQFGKVCKSKYEHLNKHDLISKAFKDFIDKYNQ